MVFERLVRFERLFPEPLDTFYHIQHQVTVEKPLSGFRGCHRAPPTLQSDWSYLARLEDLVPLA